MDYYTYDPAVLKRLQDTEREMLKDFIDICEKNSIDYFGVGGTAIGAVRHHGMIPWDDDIDIGLLRPDYEKLLSIVQSEYSDKYFILNALTHPHFPLMTSQFTKRDTTFRIKSLEGLSCPFGIFLDLFCFDNVPNEEKRMRRQAKRAWFYGKLFLLYHVKKPIVYQKGFWRKCVLAACWLGHYIMRIIHLSPRYLYRNAYGAATQYSDAKTNRVAFMFDPKPYTSILNKEDIMPTRKLQFDGLDMRFPRHVEAYLERRYGDYMRLPPENDRHNHPPVELKF